MKKDTVQVLVCWTLLIGHIAALVAAPFSVIDFDKALDVILILLPLTGVLIGIVVQFYTSTAEDTNSVSPAIRSNSAALFLFMSFVFCGLILGVQLLYYFGRIGSIDDLKRSVSVIDTAIGGYVAIIVKSLFRTA